MSSTAAIGTCRRRLSPLCFRIAVKPSPRGGCYGQHSSVPAPVFGHSWELLGQQEMNCSSGGEEPGGTPASPWCWVWQLPLALLSLVPPRVEPAASRNQSQPSPQCLTAILEHPACASALLHDGSHPPRPSLPSSPLQCQGPFHISPGARRNTGQLKCEEAKGTARSPSW